MPTYGSLFSGVGGFDMGFDQAGYDCLFQVEWDKHCQSVLNRHWPDTPKWGDVCDVNGEELPPVDVLIFGSPCQDLSVAGKRAGIDGDRSSMFFQATRIIKEMQHATGGNYPRVIVWENVPGALSSNKGADFQAVLNEMGDCGSHLIEWAVLDAQHFGVPQRRRRIFLVAVLDAAIASRCPDPLFPVAPGRRGDYQKGIPKGKDIAGTLSGGFGSRGWSPDTDRMTFIPEVIGALQARMAKGPNAEGNGAEGVIVQSSAVKAKRAMSNVDDDRWEETDLSPTLNAFDNGGETRATVLAFTAQRVGEAPRIYEDSTPALLSRMGTGGNNTPMVNQPIHSFDTQFGSNANVFDDISPTLKSTQNAPSIQNEYAVRRLTPLECERLMGWPDDHTRWRADGTEQSDSARYKQCGNGVATPVAQWVAQQIGGIL